MEIIKIRNSLFFLSSHGIRAKRENLIFFWVIVFHSDLLLRRRISFSPSQPPQPPSSLPPATFREALLRPETTDFEAHEADLPAGGNPAGNQNLTRRHAPTFSGSLPSTRRRVSARAFFSGDRTPHTGSSGVVLVFYPSGGPTRALLIHLLAIFASAVIFCSSSVSNSSEPSPDLVPPPTATSQLCSGQLCAKIASVRLLLSMAAMCSWPLFQLDIKNAFLHGDLAEEVYMEQPPDFVAQGESGLVCRLRRSLYGLKQSPRAWFGRFSSVVQEFGMLRSTADHSVFYHHNSSGQCIYLVVYVDDIVITGSDQDGIQKLKQHLFTHFQTKDLGKLKYFLGIEIAQSSSGVVLSQRKYALDILEETDMLDCKPVDTLMDPNVKLVPGQGESFGDPGRYRRLVGKLNYLTITRPDISFPVSVVSQFLQSPCDSHWDAVIRILRYIKSTPGQGVLYENRGHTQVIGYTDADWAGSPTDRRSTFGYCVFIGGNLISLKSKKQHVVARSSAEAEYRAMALATCELIWLRHLLQELRFGKDEQMKLICDNQAALHIASNPVFHEKTKHIEVDCHFIREKIASGCIATSFVNSNDQLADIFTKSLRGPRIKYICNKLGAYDIYAPA